MTRLRFQVPTGVTVTVTLRPESVTAADFTVPVTRCYRLITGRGPWHWLSCNLGGQTSLNVHSLVSRDFQQQHRDSGRGLTSQLEIQVICQ
jgi:hypothetical protein